MQLLFKTWLADGLIRATCWTLLHSLWQGLVLAALAGGLVIATRRAGAAIRYNLLATLFFVFMAAVAGTFWWQFAHTAPQTLQNNAPALTAEQVAQLLATQTDTAIQVYHEKPIERLIAYFNEHASLVVAIWFIIFLAKTVRLMGGLVYVQRIKHYRVQTPHKDWLAKLARLSEQIGLKQNIRLLESQLVKVPMVAGFIKPVILLPVGLLANLPVDQVEAILLHELAHIRRRDFIVNLAQSFAEVVFFFNPAVLWLSSLLREEREHCCDDMAIAVTNSKTGYIQALVSFQEYHLESENGLTMAFPGKKNQLFNRVKRILDNTNKSLNMAERSFLVICFFFMGLLSVVYAQTDKNKEAAKANGKKTETTQLASEQKQPGKKAEENKTDQSIDSSRSVMISDLSVDQLYDQTQADTTIVHVKANTSIDTKVNTAIDQQYSQNVNVQAKTNINVQEAVNVNIDSSAYYKKPYTSVFKSGPTYVTYANPDTLPILQKKGSTLTGVLTHTYEGKEYKISLDQNHVTGLSVDGKKVSQKELSQYSETIRAIFREVAGDISHEHDDPLQQEKVHLKRISDEDKKIAEWKKADQYHRDHKIQVKDQKLAVDNQKLFQTDVQYHADTTVKVKRSAVEYIIEDLQKNGLVTETNPLSFSLNDKELIVNGKKVGMEYHKVFAGKYVKTYGDEFSYSKKGGNTTSRVYIKN